MGQAAPLPNGACPLQKRQTALGPGTPLSTASHHRRRLLSTRTRDGAVCGESPPTPSPLDPDLEVPHPRSDPAPTTMERVGPMGCSSRCLGKPQAWGCLQPFTQTARSAGRPATRRRGGPYVLQANRRSLGGFRRPLRPSSGPPWCVRKPDRTAGFIPRESESGFATGGPARTKPGVPGEGLGESAHGGAASVGVVGGPPVRFKDDPSGASCESTWVRQLRCRMGLAPFRKDRRRSAPGRRSLRRVTTDAVSSRPGPGTALSAASHHRHRLPSTRTWKCLTPARTRLPQPWSVSARWAALRVVWASRRLGAACSPSPKQRGVQVVLRPDAEGGLRKPDRTAGFIPRSVRVWFRNWGVASQEVV